MTQKQVDDTTMYICTGSRTSIIRIVIVSCDRMYLSYINLFRVWIVESSWLSIWLVLLVLDDK